MKAIVTFVTCLILSNFAFARIDSVQITSFHALGGTQVPLAEVCGLVKADKPEMIRLEIVADNHAIYGAVTDIYGHYCQLISATNSVRIIAHDTRVTFVGLPVMPGNPKPNEAEANLTGEL